MIRYGAAALVMAGLVLAGCASGQSTGAAGGQSSSDTTTGPSIGGPASGTPSPSGSNSADNLSASQLAAIAATCPSDQNYPQANGPTARPVPATLQASWVLRCTISTKGGSRMLV